MKAHIISIGDEILIGQTVNTNAAFIGAMLEENQIQVGKISVISDDEIKIIDELEQTLIKNDVVIATGGLGPTHDDVTRQAIVNFFKTTLVKNEDVLQDIINRFEALGREVTEINEDQAMVPEIAHILRNEYGTAPGYWIEHENSVFISLPGVPYEMKAMMEEKVIPKLVEKRGELEYITKRLTLLTNGIPESVLYEKIGNIDEVLGTAKLAFLPSPSGVKMRISVTEKSEEEAKDKLTEIEQKLRSKAGRYIFGRDDDELSAVVGRLLKERGLTLAIAESCTGGNVGNLITNNAGSSEYFERGVITYSNAAKVELLEVDEDLLVKHGAVSIEVARQMAEGVRAISGTDLGLALTGIMGPTGGTADKPVGLVIIGLSDREGCTVKKFNFNDNRIRNKQRASYAALGLLRKHLLGIPIDA